MRVLVGSLSRHFGGIESLFRSIVQANGSAGIQFDFICTDSSAANEADFIAAGARVIHIPRPSKKIWQYIRDFQKVFREGGYDIYHVNLTRFRFPLDVILAARCGVKVILHCHSTRIYTNADRKTQLIRQFEQWIFRPVMLRRSSRNIACSRNAGEYLFGRRPFVILHNGIAPDHFRYSGQGRAAVRREFGIPLDAKVVGHIGRFSTEKNHAFFLKVAKELADMDDRYYFICVGDGELRAETEAQAEKLGIGKRVMFPGKREDIGDLLSAMDVFLFPSVHEALPITLIEAQANGLPCVVSEAVTDEVDIGNGITRISLGENEKKWAAAVDRQAGKDQRPAAAKASLAGFDIRETVRKLMEIYSELV